MREITQGQNADPQIIDPRLVLIETTLHSKKLSHDLGHGGGKYRVYVNMCVL